MLSFVTLFVRPLLHGNSAKSNYTDYAPRLAAGRHTTPNLFTSLAQCTTHALRMNFQRFNGGLL